MRKQQPSTPGLLSIIYLHFLFTCSFLLIHISLSAQTNLVPNPSFEDTIACPTGLGFLSNTAVSWEEVGIPNHFHACVEDGGGADVPDNIFGVQAAFAENAYAGFTAYSTGSPSQRDYISIELSEVLQPNTEYCVEFYVSLADFTYWGVENIGAYFSEESIPNNNGLPLGFVPQIENQQGILKDKNEWMQISGTFTADAPLQWLTIGNFYNNENTQAENLALGGETGFTELGFYYIDSISVVALESVAVEMQGVDILTQAEAAVLCQGNAQTLTATGGESYKWFNLEDPFTLLSDADTLAFEANNTESFILQTTNFDCVREYVFTIEVRPEPQIEIAFDSTCPTYNLLLSASGTDIVEDAIYEWSFYQNGAVIATEDTRGGAEIFDMAVDSVILTVSNLSDCSASDTLLVDFLNDCQPCQDGFRNLAANASLEYYQQCPNDLGDFNEVSQWQNPTNASTDYLHKCANTVPSNLYGNQSPSNGDAYLGFFAYAANDYREYASVPILQPLEIGKNYCVRFEVSLADSSGQALQSLGAHFSENSIEVNTQAPLFGFTPQIEFESDSVWSDKENWTSVSGIFEAQSAASWLTIGNFKDNENSSIADLDSTFLFDDSAYYYLDNVSIVELPALSILNENNEPFTTPTVCVGESVIAQVLGEDYCNFAWIKAGNPLDTLGFEASTLLSSNEAGLQDFVLLADFGGCTLTDTIQINFEPFPQVSFDLIPNCAGAVTILTNTSSETVEGALFEWDFGDGTSIAGLSSVANLYETPGSYTVQLTVTNPSGCKASFVELYEVTDICDPCNGENNLVSNSSFEEGICPDSTGQIDRASFWFSPENDDRSSLFNGCNPDDIAGVPDNAFGSQTPRTELSYAGFKAYSPIPSEQQFVTNQLGNSLEIGTEYCVSMYVNLADSSDFAISSLGFYFTVSNPTGSTLLSLTPQVANIDTKIVRDTLNWVEISGTFIPDQNYRFLTIGNFKTILNPQEIESIGDFNPFGFAYYYIDDVSVTPMEISAVEDQEICEGETLTLTGSSNTCETYWVNANKPLNVIATGTELVVSPTSNTTYIFVGQNGNCSVTDSVNVLVKSLPKIDSISTHPKICKGQNTELLVELEEVGDYQIQWSPVELLVNANTPNPITLTDTSTTFFVTITDIASNCSITDSVKLQVNELPIAAIDADSLFVCAGDSLRVNASGGDIFAWEPAEAVSDPTIADPFVYSPDETIQLKVTVSNSETFCSSMDSLIVEAGKTYVPDTTYVSICEGDTYSANDLVLGLMGVPFDALEYRWEPTINLSSTDTRNTVISTPFDEIYTLFFIDKDGCEGTVSINVDVNQVPNAGPDVSICEGGLVQLNASSGAAAYLWSPLDGLSDHTIANPIASPSVTTTYIVIATYINQSGSCVNNDMITVFVNERGPSGTSEDQTICRGDSTQLSAFGGNIYEWTPTATLSDSTIANPMAFPEETTTYYVRIFNSTTQCESFDSLTITVKEEAIPTINTPENQIICASPLMPTEICLDLEYDGCEPLNFNVLTQLSSEIVQIDNNCFTYESAFAGARSDTIEIQLCTAETLQCDTTTAILIHCDEAPQWPVDFIQRNACSEGLYQLNLPQATDADGEEDMLTYSITTPPTNGTATLDDLQLTYLSDSGFSGVENIVVTVCDNLYPFDDCANLTVRLNVTPNSAPVAEDFNVVVPYETQEIICIEVQDADGDPTTISIIEVPENGLLEAASLNCAFYTPNDNFYGQDTMIVVACDACNACDTATVAITVPAPSDPPIVADTTVTTNYETPITVCLDIVEPNSESFDLTLLSSPSNGILNIQNDSCVLYTPTSEFPYTENIDISVCDVLQNCTDITLTILVTEPINLPPTVADTTATTISNTAVTFCFDPDDPEDDELTMSILTEPLNGSALVVSDTCVIYVSNPNFFGVDSVQVLVCDPKGNCDTAWGVITVFPSEDFPPVVSDTTIVTTSGTLTTTCLEIEELNGDDYSITFEDATPPLPQVIDANCFSYTPPPEFIGEMVFTANVCDENNNCTSITVTYTVEPNGNIAPSVEPIDPVRLNLGATSEVCIEATDANGDNLTYQLAAIEPSLGNVGTFTDNCFTYFAPADGSGTVSVTINVCDDQDPRLCTPIVIEFQLNQAPVATPEQNNVEVNQGETVTACLTIEEPEGDATTITIIDDADNGTTTLSGNCIDYAPTGNFAGMDEVTLEVCDELGACTTVSIGFEVVDVLAANNDDFNVEDNNTLTANFIENDNFTNLNDLTINIVSPPSNGEVVLNSGSPTFSYTPNVDYVGSDSFVYEICLPNVGCEQATVTILVENLLEAIDDLAQMVENTPSVEISILDNDAFPNFNVLDVEVTEGVSNGSLALNQSTFVATYFPNADFVGTDTFEYSIFDPERGLDTARVVIEVSKELVPPTALDDSATTFEGESVVISVLANDTGEGLFLSRIVDAPINGMASINSDGTIGYTPNAGFLGIETFTYEVCNVDDLCATATVTIEVEEKDIVVCEIKVYGAITPNGDNKNEVFVIEGLDCNGNDQNELIIFNRWGDEVFRTQNYGASNFWDGRYEGAGETVPDGTYFYMLTIEGKDLVEKGFLEVQK